MESWQEIWYTIKQNKLRTFLTGFSVAWGVFMLVILLGAGSGLVNGVKHEFSSDAVNAGGVWTRQTSIPYKGTKAGTRIHLNNEDYKAIKNGMDGIEFISGRYNVWGGATTKYKGKIFTYNVWGVHKDFDKIEAVEVLEGRFINPQDVSKTRKVCLISTKIEEDLFGEDRSIGELIQINKVFFRVIGVFEDPGGENELNRIYIPVTVAQQLNKNRPHLKNITITFTSNDVSNREEVLLSAKKLIAERHQVSLEDKAAIGSWNKFKHFKQIIDTLSGVRLFLWFVGIGTIIAGIVGISNIMMIVAKERTREIGLRKALGGTSNSIIRLFLMESVTITFISGYIGLLAGFSILELVTELLNSAGGTGTFFKDPQVDFTTTFGALVLIIISGLLAGYFPAKKAAKVNPIEALRDE